MTTLTQTPTNSFLVQTPPGKGLWSNWLKATKKGYSLEVATDAEYTSNVCQNREGLVTASMPLDSEAVQIAVASGVNYINPELPFLHECPSLGLGLEPTWTTEWSLTDILGFDSDCWDESEVGLKKKCRALDLKVYFYHGDADVPLMFASQAAQKWISNNQGRPFGKLDMVSTKNGVSNRATKKATPLTLMLGAVAYRLHLTYVDMVKLGPPGKGYKGLLDICGISTDDKGLLDVYKSRMLVPYDPNHPEGSKELHETFMVYTAGDVKFVPQMLEARAKLENDIAVAITGVSLDKSIHYGNGSFNMALLSGGIEEDAGSNQPWKHMMGVENPNPNTVMQYASFTYHSRFAETQRVKLGMSAGGMARNMNPSKVVYDGPIVDNDGKGMYVSIMNETSYCFGIPTYWGADNNPKRDKKSLASFLKDYKNELVDRCWVAVASAEELPFAQSLILSKLVGKAKSALEEHSKITESMKSKDAFDDSVVLLIKQIHNGILTSDVLDVAKAAMSPSEWKSFCSLVEVQAYAVYEKSNQKQTWADMDADFSKYSGTIIETVDSQGRNIQTEDRSKAWIAIPLSDYAGRMGDLRSQIKVQREVTRKQMYLITDPSELSGLQIIESRLTSQQEGFKLMGNSVFGALSSSILPMANLVTAHNITAAGRAWVWAHAIAMNAAVSITDGGFFQMNTVRHPRTYKKGGETLKRLDSMNTRTLLVRPEKIAVDDLKRASTLSPLAITGAWVLESDATNPEVSHLYSTCGTYDMTGSEEHWDELSNLCYEHMVSYWTDNKGYCPRVVLSVEHAIKDVYVKGIAHGQTNYALLKTDDKLKIKARGHKTELDRHSRVEGVDGTELSDFVAMANSLMEGEKLPAYEPSFRPEMLKSDIYRRGVNSQTDNLIKQKGILPGSTVHKKAWLRPLTLSMFQFQTLAQREAWFSQHESVKNSDGYGLEKFFIDEVGELDYVLMVETIQSKIDDGAMSFLSEKSAKGRAAINKLRELPNHPYN